jgi:hypothetical protein
LLVSWLLFYVASGAAEPFENATISKATGSVIKGKNSVQTGPNSRVELVFKDQTIARGREREVSIPRRLARSGARRRNSPLFVPREAGDTTIRRGFGRVTTTAGGDFQLANISGNIRVTCLNGKLSVSMKGNSKSRGLRAGQTLNVAAGATSLPKSDTIDLKILMSTSGLLKMGTLPSQSKLESNARKQSVTLPINLPGGAQNEIATAQTTRLVESQQIAAQQLLATQQETARQLAIQQAEQEQAIARQHSRSSSSCSSASEPGRRR